MPKKFLFSGGIATAFLVVIVLIYLTAIPKPVVAPSKNEASTSAASVPPDLKGNEDAFKNALNLYIQKKQEGIDMKNGPCLGKIAEDWVLDITHKPKLAVDEKPQNQCADYTSGKVKHFIELDPDGKLIGFQ